MSFAILGLGTAVPDCAMLAAEGAAVARRLSCPTDEQATWLRDIYAHSGIRKRHFVLGRDLIDDLLHGTRASGSVFLPSGADDDLGPTTGQRMAIYADSAGPLALRAARGALEQGGVAPSSITHLVTVSCTGFRAPGVDVELIQGLGLPSTTERTHLGYMGCHGALNGLRVARALAAAESGACVLLCAVELCSLHYQYRWEAQLVIANALFGDGAAAVVGTAAPAAPAGAWQASASGSCVFPGSADAMTWTVSDHGFVMSLSRRVPGLIARHLRPWLAAWLDRHNLAVDQVASWVIHPGGPKILDAVEDSLELPRAQTLPSREVFAEYGNMSSPTVLFILDRLRSLDAARPCVALGFGPGLTVEATLFR